MDEQRFDDLTRAFAADPTGALSRRRLLRGLAAGALGLGYGFGLGPRRKTAGAACPPDQTSRRGGACVCRVGGRPPDAASGRCPCQGQLTHCGEACVDLRRDPANCGGCGVACPTGQTCRGGACVYSGGNGGGPDANGDCPAGQATCGRQGCIDVASDTANCGACRHVCPSPAPGTCQGAAVCTNGVCGFAPVAAGTVCRPAAGPCDLPEVCDGASLACPIDAFAQTTVECRPSAGPCDVAEYCTGAAACPPDAFQPATVECRSATCHDGVATRAATCPASGPACPEVVAAACTPYVCGATDCLTACASDADCVPSHHCDAGVCLADVGLGLACDEASDCASGFCVGGLCCNTACAGQCEACDLTGTVGTCSPRPSGAVCDDGDACTRTDACDGAGRCVGSDSVVCTALDLCHDVGTCDPTTGVCSNPDKPDGTPCNDDNACTVGDTCQAGECIVGSPRQCLNTHGLCVTVSCAPAAGCVETPVAYGTPCLDFFKCDGNEICDGAGNCIEGTPVTCDACNACDPGTGTCVPANNGASCSGDGNLCYGRFVCDGGACVGADPVECAAAAPCHDEGVCDPATGLCSNPNSANGTACDGGLCCDGTCSACGCGLPLGSPCSDPFQCCSGLICQPMDSFYCPNRPWSCCKSYGGSCTQHCDCCDRMWCNSQGQCMNHPFA
jgi:hypothetical protein